MRSILSEEESPVWLPRELQLKRLRRVIDAELTQVERQTVTAYYLQELNISQIAREWGVNKSTVLRNLRRAEEKLKRYLKY